ncbi:MAG: flippase-like domain-containing protein [Flavobacteriales bacterium]|nr:flippase-like domain-containing protein [Flavobacteriales bacterium]
MNKKIKNILTVVVSLVIAVGLLYLAVPDAQTIEKIKDAFIRADYSWIFLSAGFGLLAYWIRAVRWNLLLEPMNYKISNWNALWSLSFGYFMNLGIPRSGEVARASVLQKTENVPFATSFGTIITERIVDMLFMLLFLLLTAIFSYPALLGFFELIGADNNPTEEKSYLLYYIAIAIMLVVLVLFFVFKKKIMSLGITKKIVELFKNFIIGVVSIFRLKQTGKFIILSFGIWICYYFAAFFVVYSLPETSFLTLKDGFFLVAIGTLGMMVPASGGIGAYHAAVKFGFMAMFISLGKSELEGADVGLSYAFLSHTLQMVIMIVMGIISVPFIFKKK